MFLMVKLSWKSILLVFILIGVVSLPLIITGIVYLSISGINNIWGWLFMGSGIMFMVINIVLLLQLGTSLKFVEETPEDL